MRKGLQQIRWEWGILLWMSLILTACGGNPASSAPPSPTPRIVNSPTRSTPTVRTGLPFYGVAFLALDDHGNVYASDNDRPNNQARIVKLAPDGSLLAEWHLFKPTAHPVGLAVDPQGLLYVAVREENAIYKISPTGQLLTKVPIRGQIPVGLTLDQQGNIYVAAFVSNTVEKYAPDGTWLATFGGAGGKSALFAHPTDVAVDRQGTLYVIDQGNRRIQKLAPTGQVLATWGQPGQFTQPFGIAVDGQDHLFIGDVGKGTVQERSSDGSIVSSWGTSGDGTVLIGSPLGLTVDKEGNVYVADSSADSDGVVSLTQILKLSPTGTVLATWK